MISLCWIGFYSPSNIRFGVWGCFGHSAPAGKAGGKECLLLGVGPIPPKSGLSTLESSQGFVAHKCGGLQVPTLTNSSSVTVMSSQLELCAAGEALALTNVGSM